jgi:hypothetical protein
MSGINDTQQHRFGDRTRHYTFLICSRQGSSQLHTAWLWAGGSLVATIARVIGSVDVDWDKCQDPTPPTRRDPLTAYGVQKHVQRRLAAIRTDLDPFSDTEAYALMLDRYRMLDRELRSGALDIALGPSQRSSATGSGWRFLAVDAAWRDPDPRSRTMRQLQVADRIAFKVWRRSRGLQIAAAGFSVLVLALLILGWPAWSGIPLWKEWTLSLGQVAIAMVVFVVVLAGLPVLQLLNVRKTLQQFLVGMGMATMGFIAARLHLYVFDKLFLWQGRLVPRDAESTVVPPNAAFRLD